MSHPKWFFAAAAVLAIGLSTPLAAEPREVAGTVAEIGERTLVVENRRGEALTFRRNKRTEVEGRKSWKKVRVGDRVIVEWKLREKGPPRARRVIVIRKAGKK